MATDGIVAHRIQASGLLTIMSGQQAYSSHSLLLLLCQLRDLVTDVKLTRLMVVLVGVWAQIVQGAVAMGWNALVGSWTTKGGSVISLQA
jgi:hypothetical protein